MYRLLFHDPAAVWVEFHDYRLIVTDAMFCAIGRERGELRHGVTCLALAIRTSRVFRRIDDEWRQIHHHGSIEDPALLARYQLAFK